MIGRNCIPDIGEGFRRFLTAASIAEFVNAGIAEELRSAQTSLLDTHSL
jgi:hypothetical protein